MQEVPPGQPTPGQTYVVQSQPTPPSGIVRRRRLPSHHVWADERMIPFLQGDRTRCKLTGRPILTAELIPIVISYMTSL